jgi:hypothetical protein
MSTPPDLERLSDSRYVVFIVRVLVDKDDQVLQGELGGGGEPERSIRFRGKDGLVAAIEAYVSRAPEQA